MRAGNIIPKEAILSVRHLNKQFGGVHAVHNCTFDIRGGLITSIIGPNGAGKTTLFNIICGIIPPDSGTIHFNSQDITGLPTHKIARKGISRTFQQARLFKNMTVQENLDLAAGSGNQNKDLLRQIVLPERSKRAGDLSYGQIRLVELARAITKPHTALLLDEPTAGVNPKVRTELKGLLRMLKKRGMTIVLIEHDMEFVMSISDEVIVMAEGAVLARGSPKEVQNNKQVLEVYLGK